MQTAVGWPLRPPHSRNLWQVYGNLLNSPQRWSAEALALNLFRCNGSMGSRTAGRPCLLLKGRYLSCRAEIPYTFNSLSLFLQSKEALYGLQAAARFAGHVDTGRSSFSDPLMGGVA